MTKERLLLTFLLLWQSIDAKTLLDELRENPNFSKVKEIVNGSRILSISLETRGYTAFIPDNEAMERYQGVKDENLISYHLANIPYRIQDVPDEITTELTGNPRLYVTKIPSGEPSISGWENYEYYINNAKVISPNHRAETIHGEFQYFHTVDQVIAPTVSQVKGREAHLYRHPDARKILEKSSAYGLTSKFNLKELDTRVKELRMQDSFGIPGKNTFFMPVNQAFKNIDKTDKLIIKKEVIKGHIVPNEVLFTRTVRDSQKSYRTLTFSNEQEVSISIENVTNRETKDVTYYAVSTTWSKTSQTNESTLARIIKGNIPVSNGVIHLIDRPLMVVAYNILSYVQEKEGQVKEFNDLLVNHYPDMINMLVTKKDVTLFAPSNDAFEMVNTNRLQKIIANKEKLEKVLRLHLIDRKLTTDEIVMKSVNEPFQEETMTTGRKLYFAVNNRNAAKPSISVEGGGVNASIITPNIVTKNGVIHIIDRILGIPSQTIYEKLASDPMLSSTFRLSEQKNWNNPLKDRSKRFTLFVPSNQAWEYIKRQMPSAYKKLFNGNYPSHSRNILQRHMIVNDDLTMEELERLTTNSTLIRDNLRQTQLQMTRGKIYFQARVSQNFGAYYLEWNGLQAKVVRPDLECVNGVVHVIDKVLMAKRDVTVSGSIPLNTAGAATLISAVMSVTLAWTLI